MTKDNTMKNVMDLQLPLSKNEDVNKSKIIAIEIINE